MKIEHIKMLHEMGFSNDQIMELVTTGKTMLTSDQLNGQPAEDTIPESQPAEPESKPAEPESKPAEPESQPAEPEKPAEDLRIQQMQNQINDLVKQMQQNNLRTASVKILPEADLEKKTDEAMAELIRPTINKGGNTR